MALDEVRAKDVLKEKPRTPYCSECWAKKAGITSTEGKLELLALGQTFSIGTVFSREVGVCQECGMEGDVFRFFPN